MIIDKFKEWFERQPRRVQRAVVTTQARKIDKGQRRRLYLTKLSTTGQGYVCPKCHVWYGTAEARTTCRKSHAVKEVA